MQPGYGRDCSHQQTQWRRSGAPGKKPGRIPASAEAGSCSQLLFRLYPEKVSAATSALGALLSYSCPRCRRGPIFRGSLFQGWLAMHQRCPVCGLEYEREEGYFVGAMIVSYVLSIPPVLALMSLFWMLTNWSLQRLLVAAFLAYLPFVPEMVRFSRVVWIHMDRAFDPE
jgi:uncharacterized protein (DUF983 family)